MIQFDDIMWGYQGSPPNSWQVSDTLLWGMCPWRWFSSRSYRTTALTLPKIGSCHFSQLFGNIWLHFANVCSWELFQPFQVAHLDEQVGQITDLKLPPCDPPQHWHSDVILKRRLVGWIMVAVIESSAFHPWLNEAWRLLQIWVGNLCKKRPLERV